MANNRIEYIDTAKGLCMLLIVASHVGISDPWPGAYSVRVILFFVLSGFFFSAKQTPKDFLQKKVRTILWPFVFWWCLSYAIFYAGMRFVPNFSGIAAGSGILDCFTQKAYFNGPLWFLLALFFLQLICYPVERFVKVTLYRVCIYIVVGILGFTLAKYDVDLPLDIDIAMSATPFFALGVFMRQRNVMPVFSRTRYTVVSILLLYLIYLLNPIGIFMSVNRFVNSMPELYGVGAGLCIAYILICKLISEYLPWLSKALAFVGYHSLYIMCVHHLLYRPVKIVTNHYLTDPYSSITLFVITVALCLLTAPLVEKCIPFVLGKTKKK